MAQRLFGFKKQKVKMDLQRVNGNGGNGGQSQKTHHHHYYLPHRQQQRQRKKTIYMYQIISTTQHDLPFQRQYFLFVAESCHDLR